MESCPKCSQALTQVGQFWICPTHGQLPEARPFAALRVFLSYGHDANEELVCLIKTDLEKRGHDVWFDKNEIKFGDEWRRAITDGILVSNRVLSFLSKHSTRDPGVCRDEIAIAIGVKGGNIQTILVESEEEVQPPVNIGHIQWLDMHEWKDRRAADGAAWEQWYQAKLAEIVRVVESDESRRFAGEIETLNGHLKPIKSEARICQLLSKGFYGRQWLFEAVEKWRQDTKLDSRLFWIMGSPGVGKSAFAAQLTHTRGDTVIAAQFCEWDKPDHRNEPRVVRSLAFQLATRLPDYRKLLLTLPEIAELDRKDAGEMFDYLLASPLRSVIHGGRERYLIVIDALDEAGEAGRNPLVEMLARNAQRLPDWLGLVVTSRPEFDVKTPLQALNPFPLDTQSESNRADIRDYLRRELALHLQHRSDANRLVGQILEMSEGVFLYVERFCDAVRQGHLSLDRPEQFPRGLGGMFCQYFQRQFPDEEKYETMIEPALGAILAAREPLPVEILQKLFGWRETQLRKWLRILGSLFPVSTEGGHEVIKPYHKSLADWLADGAKAGPYFVSELEGHRVLRDYCRQSWLQNDFALAHFPGHLAGCRDYEELSSLLISADFVRTKRMRLGYEMLSNDYQWANHCLAVLKTDYDRGLFKRVSETARSLVGFSGRRTATAHVEEFLRSGRCRHLIITGIGGIGKTLLLKHVWFENIRSRVFITLRSGAHTSGQEVVEHIVDCAFDQIAGRAPNSANREAGIHLMSEVNSRVECLIIDEVERIGPGWNIAFRELLRCSVKVVWSTRHREQFASEFRENAEFFALESFNAVEAVEFYAKIGLIDGSGHSVSDAKELVCELGGLPLALALSGAYIKRNGCTIGEYLARYRQVNAEVTSATTGVSASAKATFEELLSDFSGSEQMRLAELSIAAEEGPVSEEDVRQLWLESADLSADASLALLSKLQKYSLIRIDGEDLNRRIALHKLVTQLLRRINLAS